jgi:tRNA nucleotidyltransferase/poly(A) polymerase
MNQTVSREFEPAAATGRGGADSSDGTGLGVTPEALQRLAEAAQDILPGAPDGVYLVGGTVRDLLAGRQPADMDLLIRGDLARAAERIATRTGGRIVDLGKKEFALLRVASPARIVDLAPLAHPCVQADLLQRDFTINAMAYDIKAHRLIDGTGGLADLHRGIIRVVCPTAFERDPARLVRAYRMAAAFAGRLSAATRSAVAAHCHRVSAVAGERIWAELVKLFGIADSAGTLQAMAASGLLTALFPELRPAIGCTQNRHHQYDVFEHCLQAYGHLEALLAGWDHRFGARAADAATVHLKTHTVMLKYSALLHDVGKPAVRRVDGGGQARFFGHAAKSAEITAQISRRLRLSKIQRDAADAIIRHHIRPLFLFLADSNGRLSPRGRARFFKRCGEMTLPILIHAMADIMAKKAVPDERDRAFIAYCTDLIDRYRDHCRRQAQLPALVSGKDLIATFGLTPSPLFKTMLNRVRERQLAGELTTRRQALAWIDIFLKGQS